MNRFFNETATRQTSYRLKELGVTLDTNFGWFEGEDDDTVWPVDMVRHVTPTPAPSFREVLEVLPEDIKSPIDNNDTWFLEIGKDNIWYVKYDSGYFDLDGGVLQSHSVWHENPAEAATLLYIWLIEQGLVPSGQDVSGSQK